MAQQSLFSFMKDVLTFYPIPPAPRTQEEARTYSKQDFCDLIGENYEVRYSDYERMPDNDG